VQDVIETAIGGKNLTTAIDGRQRLPVRVRYSPDFREDPEELRNNVLVTASNGAQIPLGQVADLGVVMGPSMISSENGLLPTRQRADERARPRRWPVRGRGAARRRPRGENAARLLHRVERTVRKSDQCEKATRTRHPGRVRDHLHFCSTRLTTPSKKPRT